MRSLGSWEDLPVPELPDVENYKRYLDATALHERVADVVVGNAKVLRGLSASEISKRLTGRSLESSCRHGKHLLVTLDDGACLTIHFGMTGRLAYFKAMDEDPKYDRLRLDFDNGYHLAFDCRRMIGRVGLAESDTAFVAAEELGPDALDVDLTAFRKLLADRRGGIKAALMDQSLLAGIGNVYSDEILFHAGIDPRAAVEALDDDTVAALHHSLRTVLKTAIDRGAGSEELIHRLPDTYLLPHREQGAGCPRCDGKVHRAKIAGRTSYFCPACQTKGR
ncbi:MAG: formamidopyrimidine-DNA glycosylase [Rhodospirillaceae bacterium]|nr:formamidopyrimidine-DNA glycosylase [Rhodospirillaceae bacterium]